MAKTVAMIIARKDFRDEEFLEPKKVLEKAGIKIVVFSSTLNEAKGMLGAIVRPDQLLDDLNFDEFDGVVFVGGGGCSEYFNNKKALEIANTFYSKNKLISAICIAPQTLANAGILKGKKVCCFPSVKDGVAKKGALIQNDGVSVDGNIITATGPEYATKFGNAIVNYFML